MCNNHSGVAFHAARQPVASPRWAADESVHLLRNADRAIPKEASKLHDHSITWRPPPLPPPPIDTGCSGIRCARMHMTQRLYRTPTISTLGQPNSTYFFAEIRTIKKKFHTQIGTTRVSSIETFRFGSSSWTLPIPPKQFSFVNIVR